MGLGSKTLHKSLQRELAGLVAACRQPSVHSHCLARLLEENEQELLTWEAAVCSHALLFCTFPYPIGGEGPRSCSSSFLLPCQSLPLPYPPDPSVPLPQVLLCRILQDQGKTNLIYPEGLAKLSTCSLS